MMSDQKRALEILEKKPRKMDKLSRLLALSLVKDIETQKDRILTLSSSGFRPTEIAEMLRINLNTVNVTLSRARKGNLKSVKKKSVLTQTNETKGISENSNIQLQRRAHRKEKARKKEQFIQKDVGRRPGASSKLMRDSPSYSKSKKKRETNIGQLKKVFIVHGHDQVLQNEVETFLIEIGLKPIILNKQPDEGLTIIEKLEKYIDDNVDYAIVLLTPDDIGYPAAEHQREERDRKIEYRPRQNVILELGSLLQKLGRDRVCVILKGGVTLPSDMQGIVYKEVNDSIEGIRYPLMIELKAAGYEIKIGDS